MIMGDLMSRAASRAALTVLYKVGSAMTEENKREAALNGDVPCGGTVDGGNSKVMLAS